MRIAGVTGTVEDFTLRRTTLRDLDGVVHTVPNGEIKVASNQTRVWARINQDVTVAYGTDIDKAIEVVDAVGREMADDPVWKRRVLEAPRVERVEALGEYGVTLKILGTVRAADQWAASGDFRKRLLAALEANGIEIPRPGMTRAPRPARPKRTAPRNGRPGIGRRARAGPRSAGGRWPPWYSCDCRREAGCPTSRRRRLERRSAAMNSGMSSIALAHTLDVLRRATVRIRTVRPSCMSSRRSACPSP